LTTSHPSPKTTDEWLIDIYAEVRATKAELASLPCIDHNARICDVETWQSNIRANLGLAGKIMLTVISIVGLAFAGWQAIGP